MNTFHFSAYAFGVAEIIYGGLALFTHWGGVDPVTALGLIMNGAAVFGLTKQNDTMGRALAGRAGYSHD